MGIIRDITTGMLKKGKAEATKWIREEFNFPQKYPAVVYDAAQLPLPLAVVNGYGMHREFKGSEKEVDAELLTYLQELGLGEGADYVYADVTKTPKRRTLKRKIWDALIEDEEEPVLVTGHLTFYKR